MVSLSPDPRLFPSCLWLQACCSNNRLFQQQATPFRFGATPLFSAGRRAEVTHTECSCAQRGQRINRFARPRPWVCPSELGFIFLASSQHEHTAAPSSSSTARASCPSTSPSGRPQNAWPSPRPDAHSRSPRLILIAHCRPLVAAQPGSAGTCS